MEEKKYPIYSFTYKWSQDGKQSDEHGGNHEGLPEGRIWNYTSFTQMYKEELSDEEANKILQENWDKYIISDSLKDLNPELDNMSFKYKEHETWCLTWFEHYTFDTGQTDMEVLKSFQDYVERIQKLNRSNGHYGGHNFDIETPFHTLMGAEDRYRWRAYDEKDPNNYDLPAPCRCKGCKEKGVLKIAH